jgi:uncharacterized protein with HEPN domain
VSRDSHARLSDILSRISAIGTAVRALPDNLMAQEPGVPWCLIVGMRNHLAHEYFRLRPELVVRTIDLRLRDVAEACARLLSTESG